MMGGVLVLALAGCATVPPEEDPVQIRLNDLDTRFAKMAKIFVGKESMRRDAESVLPRRHAAQPTPRSRPAPSPEYGS